MGFWDSNFQCVRPNCTVYCIYVLTRNRTSFILICLLLELKKKKQKKQRPFDPWPCPWAHFWGPDKHPGFYVGSEIKHGSLWSGLIPSSCAHIGSLSVYTQLVGHGCQIKFSPLQPLSQEQDHVVCTPCSVTQITQFYICACSRWSARSEVPGSWPCFSQPRPVCHTETNMHAPWSQQGARAAGLP